MPPSSQRLASFNGVSVIVPVYNSQQTLPVLTDRIAKVLEQAAYPFEILLINDCSKDNSWAVIQELSAQDPRIIGADLSKNFGQINAIMCGLEQGRFDLALTMDDDLQHPPEEIPKLLDLMESGRYDVVYGIYDQKKDTWLKTLGSDVHHYLCNKIFKKPVHIKLSSFRLIGPACLAAIKKFRTPHPLLHPMILGMTEKIGNVTVRHEPRKNGRTGYSSKKLFDLTFDLLFYYSTLPLKFAVRFGLLVMVVSFISGLFVFVRALYHHPTQAGWASLWVLISFSCGTIIVLLGVIGEYIKRLIDEISQRPAFIVHQRANGTKNI